MHTRHPAGAGFPSHQRARQLIESNQLDAAQSMLETLLAAEPRDTAVNIELADLMYRRGQVSTSNKVLLKALDHLPRNAPLIIHLVQRLIVRGETPAARTCLDYLAQAPNRRSSCW